MALDSGFPRQSLTGAGSAGMTRFLGWLKQPANQHILAVKTNEIITIKQDRREHYYDWQAI
jgi:hypothetical protein